MSKTEISNIFAGLRKLGYTVQNFNNNKSLRGGMRNWVDSVIYNKSVFVAVEIKTKSTNDKLSEGQKDTAEKLSSLMGLNKTFHYFQIKTPAEAEILRERILRREL